MARRIASLVLPPLRPQFSPVSLLVDYYSGDSMRALSFLLIALASIPGDPPPPPPKREPEPDDPLLILRLPNSMGKSYQILDPGFTREQAQRAVDELQASIHGSLDEPPDEQYMQTLRLHRNHPPRQRPLQFPPWAPSRRVADPAKKRARKAQKRARRAGR